MQRSFAALLILLFGCALILPACDSGGGVTGGDNGNGDDGSGNTNRAPSASLSADATDVVAGDTVAVDASGSSDPDGDDLTFSWTLLKAPDGSDVSLSGDTSVVTLVADKAGDFVPEVSVSDGSASDSTEVTITAKEKLPDQVTVSFENRAADGDSLIGGDLTLSGEPVTEASGEKSGSFQAEGSRNGKRLCYTEGEFFGQDCEEITPTGDLSVTLAPDRKQVTVSAAPMDSTGAALGQAEVTVYEPWRSDSSKFDGESSVELPKRSGERALVGDWITEEANSDKLDRYISEAKTVSAAENIDMDIAVDQLLPACSDGIDNDGDGVADRADTRACTDMDGNYDPRDDNEILKGFRRTTGRYFNDSTFVSKADGERSTEIASASNAFPWSITVAKGEIKHAMEVQRSDSIPDQTHATHLKTGASNGNLTVEKTSEVVADADTSNGFVFIEVFGIDRSFFADGPHYAVYGWHGSKALGEPPSSGGKFHYYAEIQNGRGHAWSYVFEPEDIPENKSTAAGKTARARSTPLPPGGCRKVSETDRVCRVPAEK